MTFVFNYKRKQNQSIDGILYVTTLSMTLNFQILKTAARDGAADTTSTIEQTHDHNQVVMATRILGLTRERVCVCVADFLTTPIRNLFNVSHIISQIIFFT